MKTARQIQIETAKEMQRNPAQYAPFILRMRKEAIDEIKRIVYHASPRAIIQIDTLEITTLPTITDGERGKVKLLMEMFEITDEELIR